MHKSVAAAVALLAAAVTNSAAQTPQPATKPDPLVILFDSGSAAIPQDGVAVLDHASRLYRDGHPIVMVISGSTDSVGTPAENLLLSQRRSQAVLRGLVARGIPTERFQLLAKGETEPAVAAPAGTPAPENRRVEITWR